MEKTIILVAVDFSEYATKIVAHAGQLAKKLGAELLFVNVINQRDINMINQVTMYTDKISVEGYITDIVRERTAEMQKLLEAAKCTDISNRFVIKKGIPFSELIEAAIEEKVDMVVMGTKGRGNLEGILFGSQAEKMFRHCPVPLLSVRERE